MWLNDGSCVRLRPEHTNHVWNSDFVSAKMHDGRTVRMLNLIAEHTGESALAVAVLPGTSGFDRERLCTSIRQPIRRSFVALTRTSSDSISGKCL